MQANKIADLLRNKLKSFKFGILLLDCAETDHERWLFSLICKIAVEVHLYMQLRKLIWQYYHTGGMGATPPPSPYAYES